MSQPQFVPRRPVRGDNYYVSPPRRDRSWMPDRPGEVFTDGQPVGAGLGSHGPDQGYALKLARDFESRLELTPGEHVEDVISGGVAIAMKRASSFGRAPTVHDLTCAFSLFGFLDPVPDPQLVELRRALFEEVHHPHHYAERRRIVDAVPVEFLHRPHTAVIADATNWRDVLDFSVLGR